MSYASPLRWPSDVPRHKGAYLHGPFLRTTAAWVLHELEESLRKLGASNIVITSHATVLRSGEPSSIELGRAFDEPGASIFLRRNGRDLVFALDRYTTPKSNLRGLTLAIEGIRSIERYGGAGMEDRALAGFVALPAQAGTTVTHWSIIFGVVDFFEQLIAGGKREVDKRTLLETVEATYKHLARQHHSDVAGGSHEAMVELNRARDEARKELAS